MSKILKFILLYTPLAIISAPVYAIYLCIKDRLHVKQNNFKHFEPESPYEVAPPPERNSHYGVDL